MAALIFSLAVAPMLLMAPTTIEAYPDRFNCLPKTWYAGAPFQNMEISSMSAPPSTDICILTGVPTQYTPCQQYTISVTPGQNHAQKLAATHGVFLPSSGVSNQADNCQFKRTKAASIQQYLWVAPQDSQIVTFGVLCGSQSAHLIYTRNTTTFMNASATAVAGGCHAVAGAPTGDATLATAQVANMFVALAAAGAATLWF